MENLIKIKKILLFFIFILICNISNADKNYYAIKDTINYRGINYIIKNKQKSNINRKVILKNKEKQIPISYYSLFAFNIIGKQYGNIKIDSIYVVPMKISTFSVISLYFGIYKSKKYYLGSKIFEEDMAIKEDSLYLKYISERKDTLYTKHNALIYNSEIIPLKFVNLNYKGQYFEKKIIYKYNIKKYHNNKLISNDSSFFDFKIEDSYQTIQTYKHSVKIYNQNYKLIKTIYSENNSDISPINISGNYIKFNNAEYNYPSNYSIESESHLINSNTYIYHLINTITKYYLTDYSKNIYNQEIDSNLIKDTIISVPHIKVYPESIIENIDNSIGNTIKYKGPEYDWFYHNYIDLKEIINRVKNGKKFLY